MPASPPSSNPREVLTPSALNRLVRGLLEDTMPLVWVEAEIGNLSRPASGHLYFTLKDAQAQVRCAMFRARAQTLRFAPAEGQRVLARGRVTLYEPRGDYQLVVEALEDAGAGALARQLEALRARLAAEGLFAAERKRPLPAYPNRIGVVTSPSGAAIRDVLAVLARRFPLPEVELLPVPVQGREAPAAIAATLARACRSGRYDVLLLTRGGGASEDLAAFNDESVVRAVAQCTVPLVAAVGHEIDFTLVDFAADLRAPTPSAAAELLVPDATLLRARLARLHEQLGRRMNQRLQRQAQTLDGWLARLRLQHPLQRIARRRDGLQALRQRLATLLPQRIALQRARLDRRLAGLMAQSPARRFAGWRDRLAMLSQRQRLAWQQRLRRQRTRVQVAGQALHAVSPLATLRRGYAIATDAQGRVLRSTQSVAVGDPVTVRLADGELDTVVHARRVRPGEDAP